MKRRRFPPDELAPRRAPPPRPLTPDIEALVDLAVRGLRWLAADPVRVAAALGAAAAIGALLARDKDAAP